MRKLAFLTACIVALLALSGCSGPAEKSAPAPAAALTAQNDILTCRRLDPQKTTLVVSLTGNLYINDLCEAFEKKNPDVQTVVINITGGTSQVQPVIDWVINGAAPDIMFVIPGQFSAEQSAQYFEDFSADPVVSGYNTEALEKVALDGKLYWLPGPSNVSCMIYNKDLFAQYGWQVPSTLDEFVALCLQIREDTGGAVQPWNPNAKYSNELLTALEAFAYEELFAGVENHTWLEKFLSGEATFAGHMEPFYTMLQKLIDNGLLREEHFTYSATTRGNEFKAGQIAMVNGNADSMSPSEHENGYFPFPGTDGALGYINSTFTYVLGVPKKEHTDAERDAIRRFLGFVSSAEGQEIYIGDSLKISNVKGVEAALGGSLSELKDAMTQGHLFSLISFAPGSGETANFSLTTHTRQMLSGEKTAAECIAAVDEKPFLPADEAPVSPTLATAKEDFTILDVSCYLADLYREAADAQIGLIVNDETYRGNVMRIFEGPVTEDDVVTLLPRSFDNGSTLVKAAMTGRQLLDALNRPVSFNGTGNKVYAFSGLKATVAPWAELGEKYRSVTLADGTAIDPDATYTVAFWSGTVEESCIGEIITTCEGAFGELLAAKLRRDGVIAPARDGRITLVWD